VTLEFTPEGITRLAHIAFEVNERTENIGARRLSTVMERLLDEVSFDAARLRARPCHRRRLRRCAPAGPEQDEDLSRFILQWFPGWCGPRSWGSGRPRL
jgi:ATP-dependent HslUV protease ATP-binding subunit HslU